MALSDMIGERINVVGAVKTIRHCSRYRSLHRLPKEDDDIVDAG